MGTRAGSSPGPRARPLRYCLDSWSVVEWLADREPAASRVDDILPRRPVMSWINVGEVFYVVERREGRAAAVEVVDFLRARVALDLPTPERVLEAAALKAGYAMSYADAFAVATALAYDAVLLTGDPHIVEGDQAWPVEDLRPTG